nr:MAG TPA: hypothetical protein [Caudoviricetes sp.]
MAHAKLRAYFPLRLGAFVSIPPISTIPTPGFRWKPGVFCTSSMYSQPSLLDQDLTRNSLQTRATKYPL